MKKSRTIVNQSDLPDLSTGIQNFLNKIKSPENSLANLCSHHDSTFIISDAEFKNSLSFSNLTKEFELKFVNCKFSRIYLTNPSASIKDFQKLFFYECEIDDLHVKSALSSYLEFDNKCTIGRLNILEYENEVAKKFPINEETKISIDNFKRDSEILLENLKIELIAGNLHLKSLVLKNCKEVKRIDLQKGTLVKRFKIVNSEISKLEINQSNFPVCFEILGNSKIKEINDIFDPDEKNRFYGFKVDLGVTINGGKDEQRIFFNNAKNYFLAKNDKIIANQIYVRELNSYFKVLPRFRSKDWWILLINKYVSEYGTNWWRVLLVLLIINGIFCLFYLKFFEPVFPFALLFLLLKPLIFSFEAYFNSSNQEWFLIVESIRSLILIFLIYEFVVSFYKKLNNWNLWKP